MRRLLHHPLSPLSRLVRVQLAEKGVDFELVMEKPWERREEFLALNPAGEVPVFIDEDGAVAVRETIPEYIEETFSSNSLLNGSAVQRAEARRLTSWFINKFERDVTENLVGEKIIKRLSGQGYPHAIAIRAGHSNIHFHLDYIAWLSDHRTWLAGDHFSLADIAAGAQLSTIDYIAEVPWEDHPEAKDWYARIKSRPSFRAILADHLPGIPPPKHYADLDF
ncbi:FtsZ-localized protein A [Azospirillaceae bacterium]